MACTATIKTLCGKRACKSCLKKSFASHPKSKYWSAENELSPFQVLRNSNKKFIFVCPDCDHNFEASLGNVVNGKWCSYCSNKKLCADTSPNGCQSCRQKTFVMYPQSEHWSPENELLPERVFPGSHKKYIFICPDCEHNFEASLHHIVRGQWCPYCSVPPKQLCGDTSLTGCLACRAKTFAVHPRSAYWSIKNEVSPDQVFPYSPAKWFFDCPKCDHEFDSRLADVMNGKWCPYCSNTKLCEDTSPGGCQSCYQKTFATHPKAAYWSDENELPPERVFRNCNAKCKFDCPDCGHKFESVVSHITRGHWCHYCANQKMCEDTSLETGCQTCRIKTFVVHPRAVCWSSENELLPEQVFSGNSNKKFIFNCAEENHRFEVSLNSITNMNSWCPHCKNKTEKKLLHWFQSNDYNVDGQVKFDWSKNKKTDRHYTYDFQIGNILIELDGSQHFVQVSNWQSPHITRYNDRIKEYLATSNGYTVIRILQADVLSDNPKSNWQYLLKRALDITNLPAIYLISFPEREGDLVEVKYKLELHFT